MHPTAVDSETPVRPAQPYRERLLAGMADLCAAAPRAREPRAKAELGAVFARVLDGADAQTRRRFAERVAGADWLSPELARRVAADLSGPDGDPDPELRLVRKLEAAGQLKPGFLLRTLREGRLSLFKLSLSELGGLEAGDVERMLRSDRPDLLALAAAAVGLDRSVFPTVLELVRSLNGGSPRGGGGEALEAALLVVDPREAADAFRAGVDAA